MTSAEQGGRCSNITSNYTTNQEGKVEKSGGYSILEHYCQNKNKNFSLSGNINCLRSSSHAELKTQQQRGTAETGQGQAINNVKYRRSSSNYLKPATLDGCRPYHLGHGGKTAGRGYQSSVSETRIPQPKQIEPEKQEKRAVQMRIHQSKVGMNELFSRFAPRANTPKETGSADLRLGMKALIQPDLAPRASMCQTQNHSRNVSNSKVKPEVVKQLAKQERSEDMRMSLKSQQVPNSTRERGTYQTTKRASCERARSSRPRADNQSGFSHYWMNMLQTQVQHRDQPRQGSNSASSIGGRRISVNEPSQKITNCGNQGTYNCGQDTEQGHAFLKGIGENHKREFDRQIAPKERKVVDAPKIVRQENSSQISTAIKGYQVAPQPQARGDQNLVQDNALVSESLKEAVSDHRIIQSFRSTKLKPSKSCYAVPTSEDHVEYLSLELEGLPAEAADDKVLKRMFFKNAHVVKAEPQINTITGKCSGKAKVKVRCANGLKSDSLLKQLYKNGARFSVSNQQKQSDLRLENKNYKPQAAAGRSTMNHRNQWIHQENPVYEKAHREAIQKQLSSTSKLIRSSIKKTQQPKIITRQIQLMDNNSSLQESHQFRNYLFNDNNTQINTFNSSYAEMDKYNPSIHQSQQSTMASFARPPSTATAALNNLSISGKLHHLMSSQCHPGGPNEYAHTHSDSASTRRTTQQTGRPSGSNPSKNTFMHLLAQSTFDHSEGGGPSNYSRKGGKTPITSYQDENTKPIVTAFSGKKNATKTRNRVPFGERAVSSNGVRSVISSNGVRSKRPSTATTRQQTARGGGAKQFMAMTQSRRNKMMLI